MTITERRGRGLIKKKDRRNDHNPVLLDWDFCRAYSGHKFRQNYITVVVTEYRPCNEMTLKKRRHMSSICISNCIQEFLIFI